LGERYGYLDNFGTEVIFPTFEDARAFSEGLAAIKFANKCGYTAPTGSAVIANQFICQRGMAGPFRDGLARVARNGKAQVADAFVKAATSSVAHRTLPW
jgi:hypothetical protein